MDAGPLMSECKTLKVSPTTKSRLDNFKRDGETTDGLLDRAFDALEEHERRGGQQTAPACAECGASVTTWTIIDGNAVCEECADVDFGV